jgi:hypothetical protein
MKALLVLLLLVMPTRALPAEPSASVKAEIGQLLSALATSKCEFYRNGTWYNAADAQAHLTKKYEYLLDKGRISTTERFIADAARRAARAASGTRCDVPIARPSRVRRGSRTSWPDSGRSPSSNRNPERLTAPGFVWCCPTRFARGRPAAEHPAMA